MKQVAVVSGKGGTGKTSVIASLASLAKDSVLVDGDVDAADLHLLLEPTIVRREEFRSSRTACIDEGACSACGECREVCRFDAISSDLIVDRFACEGCGVCAHVCPEQAIDLEENVSGEWFVSETRVGPLVHARLGIAEENSGKLVAVIRNEAKTLGRERGLGLVLIDGPPGIGCPVISSITGVDLVLVVAEPTLSGIHDMERIVGLAVHFDIPVIACINRYDINLDMTARIDTLCNREGIRLCGRIPFDQRVTEAMIHRQSVVEYCSDGAASAIEEVWDGVLASLGR
ncbi:(4Fe-4S)-binding protein [candidate division TA06 bacterium DG_24]|uniref:(4Fe-4S)-binding protein n=3 Tax=Bacteria division TA06 TaxID=1156500 RepID=A0A0S8JC38_UNCT6|nr:MAG: (4Fe-4S)-binding protein [candidate division TA06 bacterium DG_24]KPK70576.1 MAG: (4Fe-4S)-binding protein [candidate division TA06 bacterium SM23_40]KPL06428.1 MAG: (4Fe-4S)-binding protein [candidate division TA06 bacterium SM1_40]